MRKNLKKLMLNLGMLIPVVASPLVVASCWWDPKRPDPLKPINPKPNDPSKEPEKEPEKKEGYITWKSTNEEYAKDNNVYYFKDLVYNVANRGEGSTLNNPDDYFDKNTNKFKDNVYNAQGWHKIVPSLWMSLEEMMSFNIDKEYPMEKYGDIPSRLMTNDINGACDIYQMLRQFASSEANNHFAPGDKFASIWEAHKSFLDEMSQYLNSDQTLDSLIRTNNINDLYAYMRHYGADATWATAFDKYVDGMINAVDDGWMKTTMSDLKQRMSNKWSSVPTASYKHFFMPYTLGSNNKFKAKFSDKHNDMYSGKYTKDGIYDQWNNTAHIFFEMLRLNSMEIKSKAMYQSLVRWYLSLYDINKDENKEYFSEITGARKNAFKTMSEQLMKNILEFLDWSNLLATEMESPENKNVTISFMFPQGNKTDFEYSWVFAYRFLFDVLVPTFMANNFELPGSFIDFSRWLSNKNNEPYYIYRFTLNYLNQIFKDKDKNFKNLEAYVNSYENSLDATKKEAAKDTFLEKIIKNWNSVLKMNVKTNKF
ncbi:CDS14 family ICE transfer lipoprotein [Metamycoplasma buccale]|uniref:CDS14 family ICE transfer lipoprotein n=1 Tax=Metamycoplasma buccale TaxID=55602 RepID=UPI00398F4686